MIQAVLFDFNGVIVNDESLHLKAYTEALKTDGVELTEEDYYKCLGMDDVTFTRAAFERAGKKDIDEATINRVIARELELHRELIADDLPLCAGIVTFVKALARRYTLGIVSMAQRGEIDYVLERAGLSDAFSIIVSGEGAKACKPDPWCCRTALEMLNEKRCANGQSPLALAACLVIEDSPPGIQAARAAGMRSLGVTNTVKEDALRAAGADVVTASLADWTPDAVHHVFDSKDEA